MTKIGDIKVTWIYGMTQLSYIPGIEEMNILTFNTK